MFRFGEKPMKKLVKKLVALVCLCVAFVATPVFADFYVGIDAYRSGDYATALTELRPLAEQGDEIAQFYVGRMYYEGGEGVPQDYKEAKKWFILSAEQGDSGAKYYLRAATWWRLSAEQGDARAQLNLGTAYYEGNGVIQDYKEAEKWFRLSAEQGNKTGQGKLGSLYYYGEGILQDNVLAHMWFNIAASNRDDESAENRANIAKRMTPLQIEEAQALARACIAKNYKGC